MSISPGVPYTLLVGFFPSCSRLPGCARDNAFADEPESCQNYLATQGQTYCVTYAVLPVAETLPLSFHSAILPPLPSTHAGILMYIAWVWLVPTAYFFAANMKPAMPTGVWFQVCVYTYVCTWDWVLCCIYTCMYIRASVCVCTCACTHTLCTMQADSLTLTLLASESFNLPSPPVASIGPSRSDVDCHCSKCVRLHSHLCGLP